MTFEGIFYSHVGPSMSGRSPRSAFPFPSQALSDIQIAVKMVQSSTNSEEHPLDIQYRSLGCQMQPLPADGHEFQVNSYTPLHCFSLSLSHSVLFLFVFMFVELNSLSLPPSLLRSLTLSYFH